MIHLYQILHHCMSGFLTTNNLHNFMEKFQIIGLVSYVNIPNIPPLILRKSKVKHSALSFGKLEQCDPPPPPKKNQNKKTIEFKLRIYEINIVKKRDDAFVKHRYIDRSILCCFHLEIKKKYQLFNREKLRWRFSKIYTGKNVAFYFPMK